MPIPATTGKLRTNIGDMEIGDYIAVDIKPANLSGGYLSGFGSPTYTTEIPVTGVVNSSGTPGYMYLIKTKKGLLIGDRVAIHTVSWDMLNSNRLIQGLPWSNGNIIPTMTSNTSPSGVASASFSDENAWKAFDKLYSLADNSVWQSDSVTDDNNAWLSYDFGTPTRVGMYSLVYGSNNVNAAPKSWTFEGWSDPEKKWIILDSQSEQTGWVIATSKQYRLPTEVRYSKYRIKIRSTVYAGSIVRIAEMEMFEMPIIRSLTGGVSFVDANGNSSITDKGLGAWPTNNEWDKYIVNFPVSKIQTGKTLDDVFHWSDVSTWCQDTPTLMLLASTNRVWRGSNLINRFAAPVSSTTNVTIGFRPVFEYKEV